MEKIYTPTTVYTNSYIYFHNLYLWYKLITVNTLIKKKIKLF